MSLKIAWICESISLLSQSLSETNLTGLGTLYFFSSVLFTDAVQFAVVHLPLGTIMVRDVGEMFLR